MMKYPSLSACFLKIFFKNTVVLPSRVRKVHWSALPEYSDRSLQSTSMNSQLLLNSNRITILVIYNCTKFLHCRNCFFKQFNFSPCKWINQKWVPYASVKISKKIYTLSDGTPWLSRNLNVAGFIIPPTPLAAHLT